MQMQRNVRSAKLFLHLFLPAILLCAACSNPSAADLLGAYGTVIARVSDDQGIAVRSVEIDVHDNPNRVGSFYSVGQLTGADGTVRIEAISPGRHGVEMTVPAGFVAGASGTTQTIEVAAGAAVTVSFVLVRR